MHKALLYNELENQTVECLVCHRNCIIKPDSTGLCRTRKNINGKLFSLVYNKPCSIHLDAIEKKPFYHFKPFSKTLSVSTLGCNFFCKHCQNYEISQSKILEQPEFTPEEIVQLALSKKAQSISYTYTEPTIFLEYALDIMKLAKKKNLSNLWVSNGYQTEETINLISPYLDAINIDYKGDKKFYKEICGNISLEKVQDSISIFHQKKIHLEITNLLIPSLNTSPQTIQEMISFISSLSPSIPLHISRFFPNYQLSHLPQTSMKEMHEAEKIAKEKLDFVYLGNIGEQNTFCPHCQTLLIDRHSEKIFISSNKCPSCNSKIPILF